MRVGMIGKMLVEKVKLEENTLNVREEMEYIKERQQELAAEGREGNEREFWKLQIVWEYLRGKLAHKGNGYLN